MRRPVAVLFAFTFAPLVFALSGRPISDLRFDYQDGSVVRSAASDGDDFLVITEEWRIAVRGQIIHKGVPAGPPFFIGDAGDALSASTVWTGSAYVVSWSHDGAIYAATVARGGGLLTPPRLVATGGSPTRVVTNGQRLLVTAPAGLVGIVGALLDANVPMPSAPGAPRASRIDADRIRVLWSATSTPILGYSIEVRASDGGFRQLGVAPGGATSAVVPLFGVPATAVRIRAWNTGGFSEPSAEAMIATGRIRAVGR
jgi:hypothetical protein